MAGRFVCRCLLFRARTARAWCGRKCCDAACLAPDLADRFGSGLHRRDEIPQAVVEVGAAAVALYSDLHEAIGGHFPLQLLEELEHFLIHPLQTEFNCNRAFKIINKIGPLITDRFRIFQT